LKAIMRVLIPIDGTPRSLAAVDLIASRKALVGRDPDVFVLHAQCQRRATS
jgi:hypothetical protein